VRGLVKCPFCGLERDFESLKSWKFRFYDVRMLRCPRCRGKFDHYQGVSPKKGKVSEFIVRLGLKRKRVAKCPHCGFEGELKLLKTWRFRWWNVYYYQCPKCSGRFRWHVDPEGKRKSFVVRVSPRALGPRS
jgi:DNA-directed RNA polymerase subunit RPC12/RpoP